jgi:hypothetical protein
MGNEGVLEAKSQVLASSSSSTSTFPTISAPENSSSSSVAETKQTDAVSHQKHLISPRNYHMNTTTISSIPTSPPPLHIGEAGYYSDPFLLPLLKRTWRDSPYYLPQEIIQNIILYLPFWVAAHFGGKIWRLINSINFRFPLNINVQNSP